MKVSTLFAAGLLALAAASPAAGAQAQGKAGDSAVRHAAEFHLSRAFLIGTWADDEDCEEGVQLLGDGRYFGEGGVSGIWYLEGDELTLTSENAVTVQVVPIDRDTIGLINADGSLGESRRCDSTEMLQPGPDEMV